MLTHRSYASFYNLAALSSSNEPQAKFVPSGTWHLSHRPRSPSDPRYPELLMRMTSRTRSPASCTTGRRCTDRNRGRVFHPGTPSHRLASPACFRPHQCGGRAIAQRRWFERGCLRYRRAPPSPYCSSQHGCRAGMARGDHQTANARRAHPARSTPQDHDTWPCSCSARLHRIANSTVFPVRRLHQGIQPSSLP